MNIGTKIKHELIKKLEESLPEYRISRNEYTLMKIEGLILGRVDIFLTNRRNGEIFLIEFEEGQGSGVTNNVCKIYYHMSHVKENRITGVIQIFGPSFYSPSFGSKSSGLVQYRTIAEYMGSELFGKKYLPIPIKFEGNKSEFRNISEERISEIVTSISQKIHNFVNRI